MPLGLSIFLLAAGAILAFAFTGDVSGLNIDTVGWILMAVGTLGVLISLVVWAPFTTTSRRTTVVDGVSGVGQRRTYVDDGPVV